jgi:rubrerythrin
MKTALHPNIYSRVKQLKPAAWWAEHFRRDLQRDWTITWDSGVALSPAERARIAASIAEFQRGESSEARSYLAKSARFAAQENDPSLHVTSQLFVASENAHADLLLRFMRQMGIPPTQSSSLDGVFRWIRGVSDLGWSSRVIIVAELIAQEYYPCLRAATTHPILTRICDRIVSEEAAHIRFQVERIVRVEMAQGSAVKRLRDLIQSALMCGTACIVYIGHRRVLSVRMSFREFFIRACSRNRRAIAAIRGLRTAVIRKTDGCHLCPTTP